MTRTPEEWIADLMGLFIQGIVIPAFPFLIVSLLDLSFPSISGKLEMHSLLQFILSFVVVDYIYYWNHRVFHKRSFWTIHRLHHSSRYLDIFVTSRNSLFTSFLIVYVWAQIIGMFFLKDSTPFMVGLGLTFALDLWRHSGMKHSQFIHSTFEWAIILPENHVLHHSLLGRTKNFGANFCFWDKLHGTYSNELIANKNLEKITNKNIWYELFYPWKVK